jgi:hypothetical protein
MPAQSNLKYVRSADFRKCLIDAATTVMLSDPFGDRIQTSFMRMDVIPTGEIITRHEDGRIELIQGITPETEPQKTVEFAIEMRPDIALQIANGLLAALQKMPSIRKAWYGIPDTLPQIGIATAGGKR